MRVYKAGSFALYSHKQAKALGNVLESLGDKVTPQAVVDAARPKKSPIHGLFQWDDSVAAEKYRQWQARIHINHLEIVIVADDKEQNTRAYHSVVIAADKSRAYMSMASVQKSPELSRQVVANAFSSLEAWQERYADYGRIFGPVFQAITKVRKKIKTKRRTVAA